MNQSRKLGWIAVIALFAVGLSPAPSRADTSTSVAITSSLGVPDRGDTARAIDGDTATETYTTPSNNLQEPSYLEFGFASTDINRIRFIKDNYVGPFDLAIQYTTSTDSDLSARTYSNVSGLANGFQGTELLNAASVNTDGTVTGDAQDSSTAWASLHFDRVTATGVRIAFTNTNPCCNHYHVYEFQAYNDVSGAPITVTAPNGGESWARGTTHSITWTFTGAPNGRTVRIELLRGATTLVQTIKTSRAIGKNGAGALVWTVPNVKAGVRYLIRVAINGTSDADTSDATFSIT